MKIQIRSRITGWDFEKQIDDLDFSSEELIDVIQEDLWDLYIDILSASSPIVPQGSFEEAEIYNRVCRNAKEYITLNRNKWIVECIRFDDICHEKQTELINVTELLLDILDDDSSTGDFDARLSKYVESCLLEFVENSTWHIENDCVWFGIDKPFVAWQIYSETEPEDIAFWFESDSWTIMTHLGDFSDSFLIWYTAECGCWTPDMSDISNSCPVQFEETDTIESILKKAETWCSENKN